MAKTRWPPKIASLVLGLSLVALPSIGQDHFERLEVAIWPEYDRPAVLVIVSVTLAAETTLPTIVPLPMPASAGVPHAVAMRGEDGGLLVAQHTVETTGEWSTVYLLADRPTVRLEYYLPLTEKDDQRLTRFFWPEGFRIDQIVYEVLHPVGASNMSLTPPADSAVEADGLTFYRAELGGRSASESFSIGLAYTKSTPALSSPQAQATVAPPSAAPVEPAESKSIWGWLPYFMAGLAVAIVLVLIFHGSQPRREG